MKNKIFFVTFFLIFLTIFGCSIDTELATFSAPKNFKLLEISSQFSTPPFIKQVNNAYAIQVAAFKTPETAYEYVNSLRQQGFSARIIEE